VSGNIDLLTLMKHIKMFFFCQTFFDDDAYYFLGCVEVWESQRLLQIFSDLLADFRFLVTCKKYQD